MSQEKPRTELSTKLVGDARLVVVNPHLRYRIDRVEFPNGSEGNYTYIDDDYAAAATVPLDRRRGKRSALLIRQERYPSQTIGWEVPAGGPKSGETQLQAAQRELREEAGIEARLWHQLPQQVENVGRGNSRSDVFVAAGVVAVHGVIDPEEAISDKRWFTMGEIEDLMLAGEISAGHTMASLAIANAFANRNPEHPISRIVG